MKVTKELAEFFMLQCAGSYNGHMSMVPHNPTLQGLMQVVGASDSSGFPKQRAFSEFCRSVANVLDEDLRNF